MKQWTNILFNYDKDHRNLYTSLYCITLSALDGIVIISCVLSNTSLKMTTYLLSKSTPVNRVACEGKDKQ